MWLVWILFACAPAPSEAAPKSMPVAKQTPAAAPFEWEVRVDGVAQPGLEGTIKKGLKGWSCGFQVDPVEHREGRVNQFGVLACDDGADLALDTTVLCATSARNPVDSGAGNLILQQGERQVVVEMSCRSPEHPGRPNLRLSPDSAPSAKLGLAEHREPPVAGSFRWQMSTDGQPSALKASGDLAQPNPAWACRYEVSGLTDPTYGYAEYATVSCAHGELTATTSVPCVKTGEAVCAVGSIRVASEAVPLTSMMLMCENVGNAGCF